MMNESNNPQNQENTNNKNRRVGKIGALGAAIAVGAGALTLAFPDEAPKQETIQVRVDNTPEAQPVVPGTELTPLPTERREAPKIEAPKVSEPHTDVAAEEESTPAPKPVDNETKDEDKEPRIPHAEPITDLPPAPSAEPTEFTDVTTNEDGETVMINEPPVEPSNQ